jgi:hypothetical protein
VVRSHCRQVLVLGWSAQQVLCCVLFRGALPLHSASALRRLAAIRLCLHNVVKASSMLCYMLLVHVFGTCGSSNTHIAGMQQGQFALDSDCLFQKPAKYLYPPNVG